MDKINCHDDRYKEILGDRRVENETKNTNKRWDNNGLKDTSVYHEDQKNGYARYSYGYNRIYDKDDMSPLKINLRLDTPSDSQQKEINRLRVQIEKLSTFVESSDERREQAEILLGQQKEELLKQIREKEVLDNRVCCLEELRRNLQRKINEISEENKSIKLALKSNEEKLSEEKERVSVLKKECSNEIAKNVELELVLQTIREELGCVTPPNNRYLSDLSLGTRQSGDDVERDCDESRVGGFAHAGAKHGEKKVTWGQLPVHSHEIKSACSPQSSSSNVDLQHRSLGSRIPKAVSKAEAGTKQTPKTQYSCLKQQSDEEALWKREKKQFEGKILLLEMDKKKLRAQIELLEEKILKQEGIGQNLRENNEVLEFRILELEYELLDKTKKEYV